jgi:hypothetical protein
MEARRSTNFNEFYRSIGEHSVNIRLQECFDKVLYHVNSRILKCKMTNIITMISKDYLKDHIETTMGLTTDFIN